MSDQSAECDGIFDLDWWSQEEYDEWTDQFSAERWRLDDEDYTIPQTFDGQCEREMRMAFNYGQSWSLREPVGMSAHMWLTQFTDIQYRERLWERMRLGIASIGNRRLD